MRFLKIAQTLAEHRQRRQYGRLVRVGIATGLGRLEIAIALSLMTLVTFKLVGRVKKEAGIDE